MTRRRRTRPGRRGRGPVGGEACGVVRVVDVAERVADDRVGEDALVPSVGESLETCFAAGGLVDGLHGSGLAEVNVRETCCVCRRGRVDWGHGREGPDGDRARTRAGAQRRVGARRGAGAEGQARRWKTRMRLKRMTCSKATSTTSGRRGCEERYWFARVARRGRAGVGGLEVTDEEPELQDGLNESAGAVPEAAMGAGVG